MSVKVGDKFELALDQTMWKDDLSGVFLKAPGKYKISRPKDMDYRSQLEWYASNRLKAQKDPTKVYYKIDEGNTWFEIKKGMNIGRIEVAIKKGVLVSKGKNKKEKPVKQNDNLFRKDKHTGMVIYNGPYKELYRLLQKNIEKELIITIEKMKDPRMLSIMLEMEQKGWNPAASPRGHIVETLTKQLNDNSIGISMIKEEEVETSTLEDEIEKARKSRENTDK